MGLGQVATTRSAEACEKVFQEQQGVASKVGMPGRHPGGTPGGFACATHSHGFTPVWGYLSLLDERWANMRWTPGLAFVAQLRSKRYLLVFNFKQSSFISMSTVETIRRSRSVFNSGSAVLPFRSAFAEPRSRGTCLEHENDTCKQRHIHSSGVAFIV